MTTSQQRSHQCPTQGSFQFDVSPYDWLVATGNEVTPSAFDLSLSETPSATGVIPQNMITLWARDSALSQWYFYAPGLEVNNGLTLYLASKDYRDFTAASKKLGSGGAG
jgi:hypothetical protein